MFNNVDLIGVPAVCNMIKQTDLKRFIIYRQGAAKGSTPVFDCSYTQNNSAAVKNFKDWAENITAYNPQNFLCYDILLFNDAEDTNDAVDKGDGKKKNKIRFCFALNAAGGQSSNNGGGNFISGLNQPTVDIAGEIAKGVQMAMLQYENKQLKEQIADLESEDEYADESAGGDVIGKVVSMMKEINENNKFMANEPAINGDEDLLNANLTEQKNKYNFLPAEIKVKNENINKALKVLWAKDKNLDTNLLKLASIAQTNDFLYNMLIAKLKDM